MKKLIYIGLVLTVCAYSVLARSDPKVRQGSKEAEVRKFIDEFADALTRNDAKTLISVTSADYTFIAPNGDEQDRDKRYSPIASGALVYSRVTYSEVKVRVYANTAVVTATVDVHSKLKGNDISGKFRSTLTLIKIRNRWVLVASQANKI